MRGTPSHRHQPSHTTERGILGRPATPPHPELSRSPPAPNDSSRSNRASGTSWPTASPCTPPSAGRTSPSALLERSVIERSTNIGRPAVRRWPETRPLRERPPRCRALRKHSAAVAVRRIIDAMVTTSWKSSPRRTSSEVRDHLDRLRRAASGRARWCRGAISSEPTGGATEPRSAARW